MAAQDSDETHRAGLQAGADEMLVKPLALQDLADVLPRTGPRSGGFHLPVWHELFEFVDAGGVARLAGLFTDDLPFQRALVPAARLRSAHWWVKGCSDGRPRAR